MKPRRLTFRFAEVFPSHDSVGHFVIRLAAAANALRLTNKLLVAHWDRLNEDEHLALLRDAIVQVWETHLVVADAANDPAVDSFMELLPKRYPGEFATGSELLAALRGEAGVTAPATRNVLRIARNATVHYGKRSDPELADVLAQLAQEDVVGHVVIGETMADVRAEFADEVIHRLTEMDHLELEDLQRLMADLSTSVLAIIHLSDTATAMLVADRQDTTERAPFDYPKRGGV